MEFLWAQNDFGRALFLFSSFHQRFIPSPSSLVNFSNYSFLCPFRRFYTISCLFYIYLRLVFGIYSFSFVYFYIYIKYFGDIQPFALSGEWTHKLNVHTKCQNNSKCLRTHLYKHLRKTVLFKRYINFVLCVYASFFHSSHVILPHYNFIVVIRLSRQLRLTWIE